MPDRISRGMVGLGCAMVLTGPVVLAGCVVAGSLAGPERSPAAPVGPAAQSAAPSPVATVQSPGGP